MILISTVVLFLLAYRPATASTVTYYIEQPLNTSFTVYDEFNGHILGLGVAGDGLLEVQPNSTTQWHFEQIFDYNYIIRESNSNRYIYVPDPKLGSLATVSKTAATVIDPTVYDNAQYKFYVRHEGPGLFFTVERHSTEQPDRYVIKLRENTDGKRQDFTFIKPQKKSNQIRATI
ncbi:hypothetical protein H112_04602 [Trichophyton rubrum D6]|uniref:Ricin B lectin domain-containing protein n=3 Tax=Trichophyton rubrum TaxID=5551 RepID=A0A178F2P9_TRIRU|nr:uncharacterized protein TERG_04372 [Trichophyton rubrum CBS 118892]EZF22540.1 hypothetical protein H100_04609 [Trichophyton rubrum MR850]EZF41583.1 hypothetical protein H102_04596 [Trichophyton rubrum CBS 100081]EZF52177.1 hypothetical protein H103_04603 [Trichophyton rubrum CBS 288.86]EZF62855.1 hypothetical protein H104_04591 [Trichophyton rubrum CBS 289.86]EZF84148.1 hypothetical protein H110_04597 [Trichophyton rubrum MR1448]EZF94871.1 hypothetical protein H113_04637 [Trichophyton rubr